MADLFSSSRQTRLQKLNRDVEWRTKTPVHNQHLYREYLNKINYVTTGGLKPIRIDDINNTDIAFIVAIGGI
jgi:hypothetical protein